MRAHSTRAVLSTGLGVLVATGVLALFACSEADPTVPEPAIVLSTASVSLTAQSGSAVPAAGTVAVTNGGGGSLESLAAAITYDTGQPSGWLAASFSGAVAPSTLTLSANAAALAAGVYTASVSVTAPGAENAPQTIAVSFTVTQAPAIALSESDVAFSAVAGGVDPAAQLVSVTNAGGGTLAALSVTIAYGTGEPVGWLTTSLSGTTAPATLTLSASAAALGSGTYTASVSVAAPGASNAPRTIDVTLNVDAAPAIAITPQSDSVLFHAMSSAPAPVNLSVTNSGGGVLTDLAADIVYAGASGWLSASLDQTTAPATLTLSATPTAVAVGSHFATVRVSAAGAQDSPAQVSVRLTRYEDGIYVSVDDQAALDDAGCGLGPAQLFGSSHYPCRSIAQGLTRAVQTGSARVLVADGVYPEPVTLVNGIDVQGGYQPDTWQRHVSTTNTIISGVSSAGNHDRTVIASGITAPTVLEGFVIRGSLNSKPGGNSYAIYVSGSDADLAIRRNVIHAGRGGPGAPGSNGAAGLAGVDGGGRDSDPAAYDGFIATGAGFCASLNDRTHANGGPRVLGSDDISGGRGGGNRCPPVFDTRSSSNPALAGQPGAGALGGAAGAAGLGGADAALTTSCALPAEQQAGTRGDDGLPGGNGSAGAGATIATGSVVGSHWVGAAGTSGTAGGNGGGGGGGGNGGGAECLSCADAKDRLGGHGGGGGSGGAGGGAGGGGAAGGAAFGIFIVGTAAPLIADNAIVQGEGGTGGNGGTGAVGGAGGSGGAGGLAGVFCAGAAGDGGNGGAGGHGAGGGGGSGGASFGIYTSGLGTPAYCEPAAGNTITGGAGGPPGSGGQSLANPGGDGVTGAVMACSFD